MAATARSTGLPCLCWLVAVVALSPVPAAVAAERFLRDDPIARDRDDLDIPCPEVLELSPTYDALESTLGNGGPGGDRASNVNTLGEVPDSSWFTNRLGHGLLSLEELVRGGDQRGGPDVSGTLRVVGAGLGTLSDSLLIVDRRGDSYFIKFDPAAHPNLGTAADIITSRFLYAAGYNVFPTCLVEIERGRLEIAPGAVVKLLGGREVPLSREFLDSVLAEAAGADGRYRVSACRLPPGRMVGRFRFFGTRGDDPNDIFRHENRRELRGLQVFAAWLNHTNCNSLNTLDIWVTEENRSFLRHFLVDFTASLGSGYDLNRRVVPKDPRSGYEDSLRGDPWATLKSALSLGLWRRPWLRARYPYPELPEVGRIESEYFEPRLWKPEYPNAAFRSARPEDSFWAAAILARFSDEMIRAVVDTGRFDNPEAARYLTQVLIRRRDKLLDHYLAQLNPLVDFRVNIDRLEFRNLGEELDPVDRCSYEYQWFTFDNQSGSEQPVDARRYTGLTQVSIPTAAAEFLKVRLRTRSETHPAWMRWVDVYLGAGPARRVVGVERESGD